jgi:hypothetical protein
VEGEDMKWFKKKPNSAPGLPDRCPEFPIGAVVVKPLLTGGYGLFKKSLHVTSPPSFLAYYELKPLTPDTFATVKEAEERWRHTLQEPTVIHLPRPTVI